MRKWLDYKVFIPYIFYNDIFEIYFIMNCFHEIRHKQKWEKQNYSDVLKNQIFIFEVVNKLINPIWKNFLSVQLKSWYDII